MKLLTLKEASRKIGVTPACLRKWHRAGKLDFIKIGPENKDIMSRDRRVCRVRESDIRNLMQVEH